MSKKLKRCPFCGHKVRMESWANYKANVHSVQCFRCGIGTRGYWDEKDARKAWNKRVKK